MKKLSILGISLCLTITIFGTSIQTFASTNTNPQYSIKSNEVLTNKLEKCTTDAERINVLEKTDPTLIKNNLNELNQTVTEAFQEIENVTTQHEANEIVKNSDNIESITLKNIDNEKLSTYTTKQHIELKDGTNLDIELTDAPEDNLIEDILSAKVYKRTRILYKDYGPRYTQIKCRVEYALYPDAYMRTRIGYELHRSKQISGRYIKGYKDEFNKLTSEVFTGPVDGGTSWTKKAKNSSKVSGSQQMYVKFKLKGITLLTWKFKVKLSATVQKFDKTGARLEIIADPQRM